MALVVSNPIKFEALRFDGTPESIEPFVRSSYAFAGPPEPDPDQPGKSWVEVAVRGGGRQHAREGHYIVRGTFPDTSFEVFTPEDFAKRFSPAAGVPSDG